jgi:hypothetical protein
VHVPEAAMNEDDFLEGGKDQVGVAGEGFDVEARAVAEDVKSPALPRDRRRENWSRR